MEINSFIVLRPFAIFFVLAIVVLLLPSLVIPWWYFMAKHMKESVELNNQKFRTELQFGIENTANLLDPTSAAAKNLARVISASLNESKSSWPEIENKVAPSLFQAFSIIPHISEIMYIGLEGPCFSYVYDHNQMYAVYSNTTASFNSRNNNDSTWYRQPVDTNTGKLYGEPIACPPLVTSNESWIQEALNSTAPPDSKDYASLKRGWSDPEDHVVLNTVKIFGQGIISLGFSVKMLTGLLNNIDHYGGNLFLATTDGEVILGGLPNTKMAVNGMSSVSLQLARALGDQKDNVVNISCFPQNGLARTSILEDGGIKHTVSCSPLKLMGLQSVYVLTLPYDKLVSAVNKNSKLALILLLVMIATMLLSILNFVLLMSRAAIREMHLCSSLMKQMEATEQAERKSMNKSIAFASASHDIRAALAGITGLIEICYDEVSPDSNLGNNLRQIDNCTKDLVGLLNSILDTSKIEAGKMLLEEEEFDLARLLEDVVDLYHPVAMKKGVDVVLDSNDGSILKFSRVKGDRGKLKQVLCNLLSNAVKFTFEGQVTVRAWAEKPSLENRIIASNRNNLWNRLSCMFHKNREEYNEFESVNARNQHPNSMKFVFEVDDTGKGIPKERRKSVFENYVQVKETALGQGGTGLGLGIVQSIVRLMHGDIGIVDKEIGEQGTRFRFSVVLTASEIAPIENPKGEIEVEGDTVFDSTHQYLGLTIRTATPGLSLRNSSPRLSLLTPSPKIEGSHVVLLIQNEARRKSSQNFMERLGIKVSVVNHWEHLHSTLSKIKAKYNVPSCSSSGKFDLGSRSENSSVRWKDMPLNSMDGTDRRQSSYRNSSVRRGAPSFVLLVIDASAGPIEILHRTVDEFKRGLHATLCKVVWLDKPTQRSIDPNSLEEDHTDDILLKPFHGSRLYQVIRLLPEFGGTSARPQKENMIHQSGKVAKDTDSSSTKHSRSRSKSRLAHSFGPAVQEEHIQTECNTGQKHTGKYLSLDPNFAPARPKLRHNKAEQHKCRPSSSSSSSSSEIQEHSNISCDKPLVGTKFLVVEDTLFLRTIAKVNLLKLGATVKLCENGEEAVQLVRSGLEKQRQHGASFVPPYDYILMDCQMPIMDGYEATRQIRKEESKYGIHIPILALSAHTTRDEAEKMLAAGMDIHIPKPLKAETLLEAIERFSN